MVDQSSLLLAFHGRFPDPRAAALFAALEARSLSASCPVTILVPCRDTTDLHRARQQFALSGDIELVALPTIELGGIPLLRRFAFEASLVGFSRSVGRYVRSRPHAGWVIATDHLVALAAKRARANVLLEIHDFPPTWHPAWRAALRSADLVLATNEWKGSELLHRFSLPEGKVFVERNGVDVTLFSSAPSREEAREKLSLPMGPAAVYTGHLYSWKGVDTFAEAMRRLPHISAYCVGGSPDDVARYRKRYADVQNLNFVGYRPHAEMPLWQAAADVLALPNTAQEEISRHYTSPMKLFEYMASGRPIVASRIPSVEEVVTDDMAYLVEPDAPEAFAEGIRRALEAPREAQERARRAQEAVQHFAWDARARRILARINS